MQVGAAAEMVLPECLCNPVGAFSRMGEWVGETAEIGWWMRDGREWPCHAIIACMATVACCMPPNWLAAPPPCLRQAPLQARPGECGAWRPVACCAEQHSR